MKEEYEYSFKVKSLEPYISYLEEKGYILESTENQVRTLYKNNSGIMARITNKNGIEELDFKNDNDSEDILKVSKETIPLVLNESNKGAILSILDILDYKESIKLVRTRYVYIKDDIKFEIDDYTSPEIIKVVAVEGKKKQVDLEYEIIKNLD